MSGIDEALVERMVTLVWKVARSELTDTLGEAQAIVALLPKPACSVEQDVRDLAAKHDVRLTEGAIKAISVYFRDRQS